MGDAAALITLLVGAIATTGVARFVKIKGRGVKVGGKVATGTFTGETKAPAKPTGVGVRGGASVGNGFNVPIGSARVGKSANKTALVGSILAVGRGDGEANTAAKIVGGAKPTVVVGTFVCRRALIWGPSHSKKTAPHAITAKVTAPNPPTHSAPKSRGESRNEAFVAGILTADALGANGAANANTCCRVNHWLVSVASISLKRWAKRGATAV